MGWSETRSWFWRFSASSSWTRTRTPEATSWFVSCAAQYPLDLDKAHIETTLEKLFKHEMLLRRDIGNEREYAFRMDLWRLWIRRQHSVWQVMRELGLEIRPVVSRRLRTTLAVAGALVSVLVVSWSAPC